MSENENDEARIEATEARAATPEPEEGPAIPNELPILPLKDLVVFPLTVVPLAVGQDRSMRLVDDVVVGNRLVGLVAQHSAEIEQAMPGQTFEVGTAAIVHKLLKVPDGTLRLAVQGVERIRIVEWTQEQPYLKARIEVIPDEEEDSVEVQALFKNALNQFERLVALVPYLPDELVTTAINITEPRQLAYLIATSLRMSLEDRQAILEIDSVRGKLEKLTSFLAHELEVLELGKKIQSEVQEELQKNQREYFLREQLKAIQRELGEGDEQATEINEYRQKIEDAHMPEEAEVEAKRELDRLAKMPTQAAEYSVIKTYLDWITSLPWNTSTGQEIDIKRAQEILDEDHYDLEEVKARILEYLAVRKLRQDRGEDEEADTAMREPILCFVGPPGVGKTSLGQSIARALGRHFTRMSLGGMRDEAEIRGHRRTYIGAMPGRIIQAIKRAQANDPVFMLDEVDKIGADWRGDPSSALLEVLDPEQNRDFRDHYLDVPFNLRKVMFITTANLLDPIPPALKDRMEILRLPGYIEDEKLHIAKNHLIPKQLRAHSLSADDIVFSDDGLLTIIRDYTREAGVRNLEREIATVCRKVAKSVAEGQTEKTEITVDKVREFLGKPKFYSEIAEATDRPGVATGLTWTPVGGDIIFIEATKMPGKKQLTVTGQLGDVMKESAQAALSYVRSRAESLGIDPEFFEKTDVHIHVPAGAIPKDGPSAGVTIVTALTSLMLDRPVRSDLAMTGEITLRGRVLPVGGIREKVLAAHRAGLKTVILPKRNEVDLDELTPEVREDMHFILVENIDEALKAALPEPALAGKEV
ncbi:MAG: endopeptidase La [Chloroflexi bacterium]|nr:endopeptidase La [Chloroflexota bacterium]